jgi:hypothetical protein
MEKEMAPVSKMKRRADDEDELIDGSEDQHVSDEEIEGSEGERLDYSDDENEVSEEEERPKV